MKFLKELQEIDTEEDLSNDLGELKAFNKIEDESSEDSDKNRQGLIRTVKGAHLIYKRKNDTDRYDELWVYTTNTKGVYQDLDIKNDILSGTDIPLNNDVSEDGEQSYEIWYSGNTILLKISNLTN